MGIKELFTVPEGKKVTEKVFGRVLFSSVCSILLCMACLAGTTWAWFTASIENEGNVIHIAPVTLHTSVTQGTQTVDVQADGSYSLPAGEYTLQITLDREDPKSTAYVLVSVQNKDPQNYYFTFPNKAGSTQTLTLTVAEEPAQINFRVTWISPDSATPAQDGDVITVGLSLDQTTEASTQATQDPTSSTEVTQSTEVSPPVTEATEQPQRGEAEQLTVTQPQTETTNPLVTRTEEETTPVTNTAAENE